MGFQFLISFFFAFSIFPIFIHSLSTIAISTTHNQTLVCAIAQNQQSSFLNCTSFPQRIQIQINHPFSSISGIVGGNGFLCAMTSNHSSSSSVMVCWRFSNVRNNMPYKRIYRGPLLKDLASGGSHICGLNGSNWLQCWQGRGFGNTNSQILSSSIAVGDDFLCGLTGLGQIWCSGNVGNSVPMGNFSQVRAGSQHACAIRVDGSLECWGDMVGLKPSDKFISIAVGDNTSCGIRLDQTVVCWGESGFSLPESLGYLNFIALEAKGRVFCGVLVANYSMLCWGSRDLDSNALIVFNEVVPGPCRPMNECSSLLLGYGTYCGEGLAICRPSVDPPVPVGPLPPPPMGKRVGKWSCKKLVAFTIVGCIGSSLGLVVLCGFLITRYFNIRCSRIHDSGRLEEGSGAESGRLDGHELEATPQILKQQLSHLVSIGTGAYLEEFSLQVLLKATDNFSDDHRIGTGSYGSVYHATLDDKREVAIKRAETLSSSSRGCLTKSGKEDKDKEDAFLNELEFLSRLNHKNLVRLLGYCEDSNERVLVYEYMENGTLFDHLHKLEYSPLMSWATRIKVALDAARGIEYLHEYAVPRIIHRDIKSSNILLNSNWTAKVSDFGLSLMGPSDDNPHLSSDAAGTMGYMDPEYYRLQLLTPKSDVYSFGIVLLELLSGCKAIHKNENGVPRNVVDYTIPYIIQHEIHRVLDRRVPPPTPFEIEAVAFVGFLAADCVMPEGRDRPTMSEVVNSLGRALEACLVTRTLSRSSTGSSIH